MSEGAPQRLREERERIGLSQRAFGELAKVSKNTQLAYENASSSIPLDYLLNLAEHGVDVQYVATGHRSTDFNGSWSPASSRGDGDDVEMDNIDLSYGLGGTFLDVGDAEAEKVKFSRRWLRQFTHAPPEDLCSTQGIGDSMEPVIFDRDTVIFDRGARLEDHVSDKMWVFAYGQIGMIKRLRPMPDGTVKIMSANRTYPDEIATGDELHIIGRVVATVRRH